ncbi:hypothetical protein [Undibacterium griseum]|uniref:DUF3147 family protein n=1 Tax=Undibacterium griseum TaxID=2762295 RepID=A0ABR6YL04_9BURK|nr:hypothetical protein [Undibacterium griseum]MBC3884558.1 hypothetical protein [Undibacterium griseum]
MREKEMNHQYQRELWISIAGYCIILFASVSFARSMDHGLSRTLIIISPIIPSLATLWAIVRQFQRMDAYLRLWSLENIGIAAGLTAALSLTYGFMESANFPLISMFWVWPALLGSWGGISCIRKWMERHS